ASRPAGPAGGPSVAQHAPAPAAPSNAREGHAMSKIFERVTPRSPCPLCGRTKFCVLIDDGRLLLCTKIEEGSIRSSKCGSGWIHVLQDRPRSTGPSSSPVATEAPPPDLRPLLERACAATPDDWAARLARRLGLPQESGIEALR